MDYNVLNFNKDILAEPLPVKPIFNLANTQQENVDVVTDENISEQPVPNQPIPGQPANNGLPVIGNEDEIPSFDFFKMTKDKVGKIPRKIRKDFFLMYEEADQQLKAIRDQINAKLKEKYDERFKYMMGSITPPRGFVSPEQVLNSPGGKYISEKIDKEYNEEFQKEFEQLSSGIYSGLIKKQKDLFATIPSARRASKTQARVVAALTDPGSNLGFSYFFDDDENYNNFSSIIQGFVKKGDISSPGYLDAVKKRDQYLEYWSNSAKAEYVERPIDQQVYINGVLHDKGAPTPQYAVRVENLKEGDNIRIPNGGAWLYWKDENGRAHYNFVKSTGKQFYTDQPLSKVAQDRLAPGEDKRGWDITQGIPDQRIPYLTVGKQGRYFANQFEISKLETLTTQGLALYGIGANAFSYSGVTQKIDPNTGTGVINPETNLPEVIRTNEEMVIKGVYRSPKQIQTDLDEVNNQLKDNPNDSELTRKKGVLERSYERSVKATGDRYRFAENMTRALGEAVYGENNWTKIKDQIRFEDVLSEQWDLYSRQGIFPALMGGTKSGKHNLTNLAYEYINYLKTDDNWKNVNTFSAENLQNSLYAFSQSRVKNIENELNQVKIDGIPFTAFASTANSVYENVNEQIDKFNKTQTKLSSIISANYDAAKNGDKEALRIYTSAVKTYNNNINTFNKNVVNNPSNTYYLQKMETPEFTENMAKLDEIDFLKKENYEMLKKQQIATEDKSKEAEGISMQPTGNIFLDGSATFLTSFINSGLSFVNSVVGLAGQAGSYIGGAVGLDGGARGSDYWAAATQTRDNEIDRYTRVEMLPENGPDGKFSFKNNILNLINMSGTAGFDLVSTLLAPEVRLIKGTSAAAKYVNRFPGLFGVFTSGHFYDEWENAERAGMKGSSKILTHIVAKNLIQTGLENLVNVKDIFPEGAVTAKGLRSKFNGELNKILSETAGTVSFADYGTAVYNTLKDLAPRVANFAFKEFGLEENGQLWAEELQNKATNIIGNYNFDEDVFNIRSAIDNIGVGLMLGPLVLLGGSARAVSNRRAETVYALVDEYGYDKVYNSLLDLRNAKLNKVQGSEKIDEKFVNSMLKELPISLSLKKPEGISDVKWLSIRASLVKKEAITKQMKSSPESMRPIFQSQIDQLDAAISTTMSTSDEALTEAFRNDAVEILKDENGVPYFSKIKQTQDATQESTGPQQEGGTEGRVTEYAPAQQGEQVQAPQPTTAPGYSDISGQGQVVPATDAKADIERRRQEEKKEYSLYDLTISENNENSYLSQGIKNLRDSARNVLIGKEYTQAQKLIQSWIDSGLTLEEVGNKLNERFNVTDISAGSKEVFAERKNNSINAKYDAELAALEGGVKPAQPSVQAQGTTTSGDISSQGQVVPATDAKADIERRRQEALSNSPASLFMFKKINPDGENLDVTDKQKETIERIIQQAIDAGKSADEIVGILNGAGYVAYYPGNTGDADVSFRTYLRNRIQGIEKRSVNEYSSTDTRAEINAKYDAELAALEGGVKPAQPSVQAQGTTTSGDISSQGQVAPGKKLFNEPNPDAAVIENQFKVSKGIDTPEPARITSLDENKSKTIADAYDQLIDNPNDPEVRSAYQAMADETMDQFDAISKAGVKVEVWTGEGEPYKNSAEMIADVRDNKHMYIFSTEAGFGENKITDEQRQQNPMLRDSGVKDVNGKPLLINDIFRFVHDYFGHTRLGNSFGAIGEENAWNVHARMYSPLARRAMTTETRGQNSWVNFNKSLRNPDGSMKKKGDEGYIPPASRPFAPQKMGLLPEEFSNIEEAYSVQPSVQPTVQPEAVTPTVAPTEVAPTEVTPARQLTEQESTRMSDARTMTPAEFSAKYPDISPELIDMIKKSGFDNEQDFDNWQAEQVSKANQVASQIRDSLFTGKADMSILSHALHNSWSKIVPGLSMVWDNYASNVEKAGYPEAYKDYAGFYDPSTKTVYINPDKMGLDTPIHEFGHVWYAVANIVDKNLTKRGRDLIRGTEYEARVRAMDEYKDLEPEEIEEEALVLAIGERGAQIIDQVRRNNFLTWLSDLFNLVANKFGVDIKIDNLSLGEFLDFAAMDILSGGNVLINSSSPVEVEASGVKPSIVSAERYAVYEPRVKPRLDTAKRMQAEGAESSDIWEQTGMENIDGKWFSELDYNAKISIDLPKAIEEMDRKGEPYIMLPIAKMFSYPEFFKVYPDARKIRVKISRYNDDYIAAYNHESKIIRLNIDPEAYEYVGGDYTSSILHEVQHHIQKVDKTDVGANIFQEFENAKGRIANTYERSGFTADANTVRSIDVDKSYTGKDLDFYNKIMSAAEFSYLTSKGEIQARNVEKRFVNPQKRQYAPTVTQDRVKASVKSVLESNPYSKFMTEDKDSYYFFHWSNEERKVIDPNKFGNNRITSREERIARPSAAFFYTRPDFSEMGVGDYGHVVKVPKDKVYPATADPLNFFDEAKSLFEKSHPGMAFGPNQQIGWITKVANAKGYEMVVAKWGKQLRAETTKKVKPEWYSRPSGWATESNPKYASLKRGFNESVGTGKIKASTEPGIPLSFDVTNRIPGMADNIKRGSIKDFEGKEAVIISSDRLTTALVDYKGFKSPHRKLGGIFYAAANKGYIWASSTAAKAKSIINDIVYDSDGYGHIAIMAMSKDSHMSNYNSILFVSDILKTLNLPSSVVAERVNKASRRATGEDIVSTKDSLSTISNKINKYFSVESARFDARKPFLMSILGNTKSGVNELGMPDFNSVSQKLSEPSLSGLRNGTVVAIMRFKGTPTVAETSPSKDGEAYHQSYPFAIKADGDVEVILLDEAYEVEKILPTFTNRGGKTISFSDAQAMYKDQAPARYTRNIFLSQPTVRLSPSSRYGLDDKWSDRAINEARTMLNNGMFQITENTATGPVGFTLSVNGNVHGVYASMQEAEDQRDNIIKATIMKGYPQVSEMVAQNILFNAKRKDFTKPLNPSAVQGIVPSVSSRGYVGDTRTRSQKIKDATKRFFRKYFTFSKGLPKEITLLKEAMGGKLSYQVSLADSMVKDLKKVAKKIGFEDWATFDQALRDYRTYNPTNPFWVGGQPGYSPAANTNPAFFNLPVEIREYVVSMRALLDGMSEQLVRNGLVSPDMALTLESNMGKYVHRSYALFTMGDEWSKKVKNNKKVIDAAHENLFQLYYAHLTATNPNMSQQEIINQANEEADKEINRILDSKKPFFGRDEASFLPYRNTGSLRQRQEQPQWLRDLMGEYTDPGTAFLLSVGETATLLQTSDYLAKLRDFGLGTVFFEEGSRPADATYRIGSMGQMLKPLEGLYTTKEMYDLLTETENNRSSKFNWVWRLMNLNKMMKTIFSPVTQTKNFVSNTGFALHNGYFDVTAMSDAWAYFRRQVVNNKSQDVLASLRPLFERGVLNQSLTAKELANIFRTNDFEQYVLDNADKPGIQDYLSDPGKLWRATNRGASRVYQASDDFWKIYAYYNEQRGLSKVLYNKDYESLSQAEKDNVDNQSADRVMNVLPTYDRVLEIFKIISKTGVLGNFTAFRAEVFRVMANSYSYAYNDIVNGIKDKNPRMVAYGTKRLLGIASYNALRMEGIYLLAKWAGFGVSGLASSVWGGGDDEDKEKAAINSFVPGWARSDDKIYDASKIKEGIIEYYTFSSVDPYATVYNIFNAYKYGNEYDENGGIIASSLEVVAPFAEPDMTIRAFVSVISNKDPYGFAIYNEDDHELIQLFEGSMYLAKETLTPGAATWLNRMFYRRDEEGKKQFGFNPSELYTAPIGARPYTANVGKTWSSELNSAINDVFNDVSQDFNKASKEDESYEDRANFRVNRSILRLHKIYTDAIRLGYPEEKLIDIMNNKQITRRIKMAILTGETFRAYDKEGKIGRRNPED